jgi:hypothetical protein
MTSASWPLNPDACNASLGKRQRLSSINSEEFTLSKSWKPLIKKKPERTKEGV